MDVKKLKQMFEERSRRNPGYSMRAFARDLQVSPSHLSECFRGVANLSPATLHRLEGLLANKFDLQTDRQLNNEFKETNTYHRFAVQPLQLDELKATIDTLGSVATFDPNPTAPLYYISLHVAPVQH